MRRNSNVCTGKLLTVTDGKSELLDEQEALNRASQQFAARGFVGTSLPDLEEAMAMDRQAIYAKFGDKGSLYRRCLQNYLERNVNPLLVQIRQTQDAEEIVSLLASFAEGNGEASTSLASLLIGALVEMESVDRDAAETADKIFCTLKTEISDQLRRLAGPHQLPGNACPNRTAAALVTALLGMLVGHRGERTREWAQFSLSDPHHVIQSVVAFFALPEKEI